MTLHPCSCRRRRRRSRRRRRRNRRRRRGRRRRRRNFNSSLAILLINARPLALVKEANVLYLGVDKWVSGRRLVDIKALGP